MSHEHRSSSNGVDEEGEVYSETTLSLYLEPPFFCPLRGPWCWCLFSAEVPPALLFSIHSLAKTLLLVHLRTIWVLSLVLCLLKTIDIFSHGTTRNRKKHLTPTRPSLSSGLSSARACVGHSFYFTI